MSATGARWKSVLERTVVAERHIDASPATVYRCIADYREHHGRFLPPQFRDLVVERGGVGAGTVVTFATVTGGRTRRFRSEIAEPEPGRMLTETDAAQGTRATFTVTPDGAGSLVRIENTFRLSPGLMGMIERVVAPRVLHGMLVDELGRLDVYARELERRAPR